MVLARRNSLLMLAGLVVAVLVAPGCAGGPDADGPGTYRVDPGGMMVMQDGGSDDPDKDWSDWWRHRGEAPEGEVWDETWTGPEMEFAPSGPDEPTEIRYSQPPGNVKTGMKGIPPLWWYYSGDEPELVVPLLGSYYSNDLVLGFFGLATVGVRNRNWVDGENARKRGVAYYDWNLLGIWRTEEHYWIENGQLMRNFTGYLFWLIPIVNEDPEPVRR